MKTRDGRAFASGVFTGKKLLVKAGGKISDNFNGSKYVQAVRTNRSIVDDQGNILTDYEFGSPSTAAQFVNGNISNGNRVWKVGKESLGEYLRKHFDKDDL